MPSDYYILLAGINGESQATGMTNNIELDSWSWGASNPASLGGKGLAAGKPSLSDFTCSFSLEAASFAIVAALTKGTVVSTATFTGRKTGGGGSPYNYLLITMTNCFITSFATGGGSNRNPSREPQHRVRKNPVPVLYPGYLKRLGYAGRSGNL